MTPTKRLSVKKPPKMMKMMKYKYMYTLSSHLGCMFTCEQTSGGMGTRGHLSLCLPQRTLRQGPGCRWLIWEVIPGSRSERGGGRNRIKAAPLPWATGTPCSKDCRTHFRIVPPRDREVRAFIYRLPELNCEGCPCGLAVLCPWGKSC